MTPQSAQPAHSILADVVARRGAEARTAQALRALQTGGVVVLCEPGGRSEADLVTAAAEIGEQTVNFMVTHGHSLLYVCMTESRCAALGLRLLRPEEQRTGRWMARVATTIEARTGVTTGISAPDRARTISVAGDPRCGAADVVSPGHVIPVVAQDGGVLASPGRTEAAVDLLALAGLFPVAAACELMNLAGSTMPLEEAVRFGVTRGFPVVSVDDVIQARAQHESLVALEPMEIATGRWGAFVKRDVREVHGSRVHRLLQPPGGSPAMASRVLVHPHCVSGDVFGACPQGCGERLDRSMRAAAADATVLVLHLDSGRAVCPGNEPPDQAVVAAVLRAAGADAASVATSDDALLD
jgi:3,4-dihydroxy 2-butanone 4-phosphate synthase/GTP cyclohydrolase II